jgi:Fe/S biogenesis protein NfuA
MIRISEAAQSHFQKLLADQPDGTCIRVFVVNPGMANAECGVSYCPPDSVEPDDERLPFNGFDAVVDSGSAPFLEDAAIDFEEQEMGSQLTLKAPNAKARKAEINPQLASHGGQVMIAEITDDGVAILQFGGGCNGCSMIDVTLKNGIEKELLERFPEEVTGVRDITDHEHGEHSYY